MAATDQNYRNQKAVDIVFAVTCVLMLVSIVWMFAQDYYRDYKVEVRHFRDVEAEMFNRTALSALPDPTVITAAEKDVEDARKSIDQQKLTEVRAGIAKLLPKKVDADDKYQAIKADYDSRVSLYNIAVDHHSIDSPEAKAERKRVEDLEKKLNEALVVSQDRQTQYDALQKQAADIQKPVTDALARLKKLNDDFDRAAKNATQKRWGWGDKFRALPVIDAFASPTRIQQYTLPDLPIDYNFKQVTRYDRCTTCHQGLERGGYTKANLRALKEVPEDLNKRLTEAKKMLAARQKLLAGTKETLGYDPDDLKINKVDLKDKDINEFCAHPRLDLFVDANSPHPAEKFGCTSCHGGQGSATDFALASHSPNDAVQKKRWEKEHDWEANHFWDFPMRPKRFIESGCVKCHHQMTDLIREGNKLEAPKLLRGYNLVRENGCFGCHDIAGIKGGRWVGPDLRLEPYPPLEDLNPSERVKALSDPLNPPGTMRKVGPSLRRISEKTNSEWVRKWIKAPRDFRPDTKMPHFYGLSNNNPATLKGTGQEEFPDVEIESIAFYLFAKSRAYLADVAAAEKKTADREKVQAEYQKLFMQHPPSDPTEKEKLKASLEELARQLILWNAAKPLTEEPDLPPLAKGEPARQQQLYRGRLLFSERGCLACHMHEGATKPQGTRGERDYLPAIDSEAHHGPNLSRITAKLGVIKPGEKEIEPDSPRRWLVHWIMNPNFYHPRTFMPITHLTQDQANDVAAWLLSQQTDWQGPSVPEIPLASLQALARVHLEKILTKTEVNDLFSTDNTKQAQVDVRLKDLKKRGSDEGELAGGVTDAKLKLYLGRKAINQLGCFGCHDIPGFEQSKPIGTPMNDWGKKDPERLAFEDIKRYVDSHHSILRKLTDKNGEPLKDKNGQLVGYKDGKTPYEEFFYESLIHDHREGFLNQKMREPRSFDYNRMRRWDDRLRMPQFRFSRQSLVPIPADAGDEEKARLMEQNARAELAEAEAREAVMTFILGLVAEPVPPKYVYEATGDRKHEVAGRKVLDKYNCNGCHLVRPGVYDVKLTPEVLAQLQSGYDTEKGATFAADFNFLHSNAWVGPVPAKPDRRTAYGVRPRFEPDSDNPLGFYVSQALRFPGKEDDKDKDLELRAGSFAALPLSEELVGSPELYQKMVRVQKLLSEAQPEQAGAAQQAFKEVRAELANKAFGGTFAELLANFQVQRDPDKYRLIAEPAPWAAGPPSLLREGEKTQPAWLYQFLRNPTEIRPQMVHDRQGKELSGVLVLRMPKFNMSDEEAMALVNYFAAVDRVNNPAIGLNYPYLTIPEKQDEYLLRKTEAYIKQLKDPKNKQQYDDRIKALDPIWNSLWDDQGKKALKARRDGIENELAEAKKALDTAKTKAAEERAKADIERLQKQLDALKDEDKQKRDFLDRQVKQWETREAYLYDGYRLAASTSSKEKMCLNCHQVGQLGPRQPQAPNLELTWERLRPQWTEHWIANPKRLSAFPPPMPQNMPADKRDYQDLFYGTPLEQIIGVRDALMNYPRLADMPIIRRRSALEVVGGP